MLVGLVRKLEDLHYVIENEAKTRGIKKELRDADIMNKRFDDFMNGKEYIPPSLEYNEYGVRYMPTLHNMDVGDVVMTESRFMIYGICQKIASVLNEIMLFITTSTDPTLNQMKPSIQFVSTDCLIDYLYRYVVSVCECSLHFQVDEMRTKGTVCI